MNDNPLNIDLSAADKTNWDLGPYNRWTFRNIKEMTKVVSVAKGTGEISGFDLKLRDLDGVTFTNVQGETLSVKEQLEKSYTDAFLVLHKGMIIQEGYFDGMRSDSLHISQSVGKSIVGILMGIYIDRGLIDPAKTVAEYVPELKDGGYGNVTVRNVLDMRTGVDYEEDYDNPSKEYKYLEVACGWKDYGDTDVPETYKKLLQSIQPNYPSGGNFKYRSLDTDVLGWICEKISGTSLAEAVSTEIWQKLGCEMEAEYTVDSEGTCMACGGYCASLRDYARFGQMVLNKGSFNGNRIVSEEWIKQSATGLTEVFEPNYTEFKPFFENAAYSNQWWVLDAKKSIHTALGIHGQYIYIDHLKDIVIVKLSSWPKASEPDFEFDDLLMMGQIATHLSA